MPPRDQELIDRWRGQPAPLLPLLHAFHERDGYLSEQALKAISKGFRIPLAELFGDVTFYHHFARDPSKAKAPRVCTGPVCRRRGGLEILASLGRECATEMPCAGRCDDPVPVLRGDRVLCGTSVGELESRPSPLPPEVTVSARRGHEECLFAYLRRSGRASLAGYRETGGYEALANAVGQPPNAILDELAASGLAGRGGAGFPTGQKWRAVAEATGSPKTIVCNADEGEPGCFKDRALLDHDPHVVIEGMALAGVATGAARGFVYLRYEYPETYRILERAIAEAEKAGILGMSVLGSDHRFDLYLRRGAGAYVCGEEGSLLNSLEGKHPFPRNRPPYPVTHGYENLPTVVNNVETLAAAAHIVRRGAEWYRSLGLDEHSGTKIISLSGDIERPGNYEAPIGLALETLLYEWAGGPGEGRTVQAVTMAGLSGGFLAGADLDVTLDEPSIRSKGSFLGAGGIMVFDDRRDMVEVAHDAMEFFADESCGKCFPCRIGTRRLAERLASKVSKGSAVSGGPKSLEIWRTEVDDLGATMKATSACGLGLAAPLITESLQRYFPDQVARHVGK